MPARGDDLGAGTCARVRDGEALQYGSRGKGGKCRCV
eukprot:CAMPEP_0177446990 /NCGR_PEP_ID=MMETSP0369-20130122/7384_1 /TAXON_ID=447022 ORGANISM="Scrippsiella hangoei-like, Strain SHHI-4" /NCGR_SAMPLE_ID=MMETSP0369 /ASSEMBLY_ACC=CAM_ASM_000364 /LENGTH=36 /DNA_ID= /DNA_START= /DNA_END= /DNA_ORIENTATION=